MDQAGARTEISGVCARAGEHGDPHCDPAFADGGRGSMREVQFAQGARRPARRVPAGRIRLPGDERIVDHWRRPRGRSGGTRPLYHVCKLGLIHGRINLAALRGAGAVCAPAVAHLHRDVEPRADREISRSAGRTRCSDWVPGGGGVFAAGQSAVTAAQMAGAPAAAARFPAYRPAAGPAVHDGSLTMAAGGPAIFRAGDYFSDAGHAGGGTAQVGRGCGGSGNHECDKYSAG